MKHILLALTILFASTQLYAQEAVLPGINKANYSGMYQSGEMGEILLVPYFSKEKADNKNFFVKRVSAMSLREEETMSLELPESYKLETMGFNMGVYVFIFTDKSKKETVLMTVRESTVLSKKTIDGSASWKVLRTMDPQNFGLATIKKNGAYTIEVMSDQLESKWKKTFNPEKSSWDVVSMESVMDKIVVIRRLLSDNGSYSYYVHTIQSETGENSNVTDMVGPDFQAYPTFFSTTEGITYVGGYYYKDAIMKGNPTGFFFATLTPEGNMNQVSKIPYSQILESVNKQLGEELTNQNNNIIFTMGGMSMSSPTYTIAGHVFSRQNNTSGTGVFKSKDIIAMRLNDQMEFKKAFVVEVPEQEIQINGNISKVNDIDLAYWMNQNDFLPLKFIKQMEGVPKVAYMKKEGKAPRQLCFTPLFLSKNDTTEMCVEASRDIENANAPTSFTFSTPYIYNTPTRGILYNNMDPNSLKAYEINNGELMIWGINLPETEPEMDELMEEEEPMGDPIEQESADEEANKPMEMGNIHLNDKLK